MNLSSPNAERTNPEAIAVGVRCRDLLAKFMKTRIQIINESLRIRSEIEQIGDDTAHWNDNVRKPHEERIDSDPDGSMQKIVEAIEKGLAKELLCVHVGAPDEIEAIPDLATADQRALELNTFFWQSATECRASVKAWPYSPEAHARALANSKINEPGSVN